MKTFSPACLAGASRSRMAIVTAVGAATTLLISAAPARAAINDSVTEHRTVHFGDLDLSRPKDAEHLYLRIRNAARQVCGDDDPIELFDLRGERQCEQDAIGNAVEQVDSPRLTAVYDRSHPHA